MFLFFFPFFRSSLLSLYTICFEFCCSFRASGFLSCKTPRTLQSGRKRRVQRFIIIIMMRGWGSMYKVVARKGRGRQSGHVLLFVFEFSRSFLFLFLYLSFRTVPILRSDEVPIRRHRTFIRTQRHLLKAATMTKILRLPRQRQSMTRQRTIHQRQATTAPPILSDIIECYKLGKKSRRIST